MSIRLTDEDKEAIITRVNFINQYFKETWETYEAVMILRQKNYKKNGDKIRSIRDPWFDNEHAYAKDVERNTQLDRDLGYGSASVETDLIHDGEYSGVIMGNGFTSFKYNCNHNRSKVFRGYRKVLVGNIYAYLYSTYGHGIPDGLLQFVDYQRDYRDKMHIFTDLAKWWDYYVGKRSIGEYTKHRNNIIEQRKKVDYIKKAHRSMYNLTTYNHIEMSSQRVIRFRKGEDELGFSSNSKFHLGMPVINALVFNLTKYHQIPLKPHDKLYHEYSASRAIMDDNDLIDNIRIYKDDSFSITFHTKHLAQRVHEILLGTVNKNQLPYYQQRIQAVQAELDTNWKEINSNSSSNEIQNHNIHTEYLKGSHNKGSIYELLKRIYQRFDDEIQRNVQRAEMYSLPHLSYENDSIFNIKAYLEGADRLIQTFSYDPIQDMTYALNPNTFGDHGYRRHANGSNILINSYRPLHSIINSLNGAIRKNDMNTIYQVVGIHDAIQHILEKLNQRINNKIPVMDA